VQLWSGTACSRRGTPSASTGSAPHTLPRARWTTCRRQQRVSGQRPRVPAIGHAWRSSSEQEIKGSPASGSCDPHRRPPHRWLRRLDSMSSVYWSLQRRKRPPWRTTSSDSRGSAPRLQCRPQSSLQRRSPRGRVSWGESRGSGPSRPTRAADRRVHAAHQSGEHGPRRPSRHRRSPPRLAAGHRRLRVPRHEAEELRGEQGSRSACRQRDDLVDEVEALRAMGDE
jgi:hypothetical protein